MLGAVAFSPFSQAPNAILDVVNGRSLTVASLGLQRFRDFLRAHRGRKLKDAAIAGHDALLFGPSNSTEMRRKSLGKTMLRIQARNAACSSGVAFE
jgi:hypothetical protein